MDRYILILTDTFEEVEALTQVDYLRRADIKSRYDFNYRKTSSYK